MVKAPVRIAVLCSGGGTNLQALIDAEKDGIIKDGKISLVISNKSGVRALSRASEAGIDAMCIPSAGTDQMTFENKLCETLDEYKIELIVLAGFLKVLSADFVKRYHERIINVHPSLIPAFCGDGFYGLKVHEAALNYGVKVTGATVHFVNEITDGGRIILQKPVAIRKNETPESLQAHVMQNAEWIILPRATQQVCRMIKYEKNGTKIDISDIQ